MTQRKPDGEHSGGRRKSEKRQRGQQVHVRFSNDEYGLLLDASRRTLIPAARLLREVFLLADAMDLVGRLGADVSKGTADCVQRAEAAGIVTRRLTDG